MKPYTLMVSMTQSRTRLLLLDETDEIMRAELPPTFVPRHPRAMTTVFEGLAMWLGCKLCVVVSADALDYSFCPELAGDLGVGVQSVFFDVQIAPPKRRGRRLKGVGHFNDLRQLHLVSGATR